MTQERRKTVRALRRLGKTKTQAESARALGLERQWVNKLKTMYGIKFNEVKKPEPQLCGRCDFRMNGNVTCLRCKWTPTRIKAFRKKLGVSQVDMSYKVLGMNLHTVARWERKKTTPSRRALEKLEEAST